MSGPILWALLTGAVSGGVWVAIVLLRRQHRLFAPHPELLDDLDRRLAQLRDVEQRLGDIEERLDENRLSPSNG